MTKEDKEGSNNEYEICPEERFFQNCIGVHLKWIMIQNMVQHLYLKLCCLSVKLCGNDSTSRLFSHQMALTDIAVYRGSAVPNNPLHINPLIYVP